MTTSAGDSLLRRLASEPQVQERVLKTIARFAALGNRPRFPAAAEALLRQAVAAPSAPTATAQLLRRLRRAWVDAAPADVDVAAANTSSSGSTGANMGDTQRWSRGRAHARLREVRPLLHRVTVGRSAAERRAFRYLDVGSAEGRITAEVADFLQLAPGAVVACDILPPPATPPSRFRYVQTDGEGLPFAAASFDLVTMFMSAHHFRRQDHMFAEARRVLRPGGALVVREHGLADRASRVYYDMLHALYETVLGTETTPEAFTAQGIHYRTGAGWVELAAEAGFECSYWGHPRHDIADSVYFLFRVGQAPVGTGVSTRSRLGLRPKKA